MFRLADIRIRPKLIALFLITGILPMLAVGLFGSKLATDALMEKSFNQLLTVQTLRKAQIETFFEDTLSEVRVLSHSSMMKELAHQLDRYRDENARQGHSFDIHSVLYQSMQRPYHAPLKQFVQEYGYNDLFVVGVEKGTVMFSISGNDDLGTKLSTGKYRDSGLAEAWRESVASERTHVADFRPYAASGGKQSAFVSQPILNEEGKALAVLVLQMSDQTITNAVDSRKGMGTTGESYLVGISPTTKRYELRSNLRSIGDGEYVVGTAIEPLDYWVDATKAGLAGGHNTYTDSQGNHVLVAYDKLDIPTLDWFLISKIDRDEVTAPIRHTYLYISYIGAALILLIILVAIYLSRSLTRPIVADMEFAKAISEGQLDTAMEVHQKDELGDLARALDKMARKLQDMDWMKRGKEGLDDQLRGEHDVDNLMKGFVAFMSKHMDAQLGALYIKEENDLVLKASYSFSNRYGNHNRIAMGEGMVGQSAMENETLLFVNVEEDAPKFHFGAGEMPLNHFLAAPISLEGDVIGVLLLGSTTTFTDLQKTFIHNNQENAAILLNAAQSRQRIQELLEQAQQQEEELRVSNEELEAQALALKESEAELQAQQEELRVTNEELEEQTKALKESQAELQAQQEELRVTNEELEERTNALEEQKQAMTEKNADLQKAQQIVRQKARDLEQASRYKSEFLANMSHELRTPLNSILILSQLFGNNKDGNLTPKQIESAKAIHSSGSDLLNLINEILDLSKVEAGKIELTIEPVRVETVVGDINRLYRDMAEEKGVGFNIDVAGNIPGSIETDSQRLQQVLRNLLTNALKFTSKGEVSLTIARPAMELLEGADLCQDTSVAFSVRDDGIGIPSEKQEAIFNAFQQADGSTSRKYGGTGLGLSISKELTSLLGGVIRLQSEEGAGSTFTVILPEKYVSKPAPSILPKGLLPDPEPEQEPETKTPVKPTTPPTPVQPVVPEVPKPAMDCKADEGVLSGFVEPPKSASPPPCESEYLEDDRMAVTPESRSLLIIEDDRNFAQVMRDFGRERGFLCLVAEDGETGLHFADYYKPSAIILDIGLPGIDGWTVMERLKENPDLRHIPVHFMSAADSALDAMRMGAIGFLSKPVSMEKVEDAFSKLEDIVAKPVSNLLLVEDDKTQRDSIRELIGNGDVMTTAVSTGQAAYDELVKGTYDCMILDLGLEDMSGFELLEKIRVSEEASRVPVIIYTGRDLSKREQAQLERYAESIIIKGVKSPERLLDESALFLHRVEANLPADKQKMLKMVHDKEAVLHGKRILLVDDDMRNVFALSSVLEDRGMDVIIAKNGEECLEKLERDNSVNCILMDIMMPIMDGYEAMRRIRKQRKFAKLPIIALTAKAMKGDRAKCIEAGASDYLTKPVNTDKLLSMMRVWLY